MAASLYLCRRGALYHFRRRLHVPGVVSRHITIPLRTAGPGQARRLAARLAVRWDTMTMDMQAHGNRGFLKAGELAAIFRAGLETELGLATSALLDLDRDSAVDQRTARVIEATYRIAACIPAEAKTIDWSLLVEHTPTFDERDRRAVALMLRAIEPHRIAHDEANMLLLEAGAPVTETTVRDARVQLLRARAEAQARMALAVHPRIAGTGNVAARLLDDDLVADLRTAAPPPLAEAAETSPFLLLDKRRFSEIIDETIVSIQVSGDWNEDVAQRRRVIHGFAWITNDKRLCDYGPDDAQRFAATLRLLPTEFRWGSSIAGNMSRPLDEVMAEVAALDGTKRGPRTLNRDLTTMSRFGRELMKTAWRPRHGKDPIVDFNAFTAGAPKDDPHDPDRMPWRADQLVTMFKSPIYVGGGRCGRRLKATVGGAVYQDAAFWVPLLLTYALLSREEACGVECADFVFSVDTPFVIVRANMTKSKDGKKAAGLKRPARYRMVPLHRELLRLGIHAYITAVEAEGRSMAFPELYRDGLTHRGGKRFYACAGRYILDYVDGVTPLLRTSAGKRSDWHSVRTSGGSALEASETKQVMVDDLLGMLERA